MRQYGSTVQTGEAAEILGCDRKTVHRLRTIGVLTPVAKRSGALGAFKFDTDEVLKVAEQRRAELKARLDRIKPEVA